MISHRKCRNLLLRYILIILACAIHQGIFKWNLELYIKSGNALAKNEILVADEIEQPAFGEKR